MRTLDPTLSHLGEKLQKAGEATVQTPMPWHFMELLCQLDEKEEALANGANNRAREKPSSVSVPRDRPESAS